ncbi:MAG TPA: hypothetical protein VGO09_01970 [Flavisolibacter sp.]|nr:hypothetical protein [Flavisolibacter sp.]
MKINYNYIISTSLVAPGTITTTIITTTTRKGCDFPYSQLGL